MLNVNVRTKARPDSGKSMGHFFACNYFSYQPLELTPMYANRYVLSSWREKTETLWFTYEKIMATEKTVPTFTNRAACQYHIHFQLALLVFLGNARDEQHRAALHIPLPATSHRKEWSQKALKWGPHSSDCNSHYGIIIGLVQFTQRVVE